ncbi:MAG TPA: lipid-A-disaccharide synthase [Stellaceae bacterium]|nr:lipid-A-disaccharide synthase [Stellaceae bacterium]
MPTNLGILAGGGALPARLVERCRETGREVFVLAFEGQTDPTLVEGVPHAWTRLGAADDAIKQLKAAGVGEIVMAGAIRRPSAAELRPDWRAARLLAKVGLRALGDDSLLRALKTELEAEGFTLIGVDRILQDHVATEGIYGRHAPDAQAQADIEYGFRVVAALGGVDVGQAAVIQEGRVLGVEGAEGTDALIERCGPLQRPGPGGVLVKAAKPGQERRIDLPTIGPRTVETAAAAGLRGIAVEAGASLVIDREKTVALADSLGLFLTGRAGAGPLFYLIAGEPSGDLLGARLMRALRERTDSRARFAGIGGEQMAAEGLESLLPIRGLAIMGVLEVLPAARRVFRWVRQTAADIERLRPDAVVTIDSSGFCFRVAERLRRKPSPPPIIHYVAPMVWAWRPYRAKHAARAADHLLTLFPFEPEYFAPLGLPATFVGHPVVELGAGQGNGAAFRERHGIAAEAPVLAVLPGSRHAEVRRLLPVFGRAAELLATQLPGLVIVVPTVETVAEEVAAAVVQWKLRAIVVSGTVEKFDAFSAATAALAASGTITLELAAAGLSMVVAYRIWPPTAWALRRTLQVKSVSLVNILEDREVVPELLQEDCTPERLALEVGRLMIDPNARKAQQEAFGALMRRLGGGERPSLRAADAILKVIADRRGGATP